jgi:hypothetical protein
MTYKIGMWWLLALVVTGSLLFLAIAVHWQQSARQWRMSVQELARSPEKVTSGARPLPEADFLIGCHRLQHGDPPGAVSSFRRAYHGGPFYESAAILAFTCMKMTRSDMPRLLEILLETWAEMRRRDLPSCRRERVFLSLIDSSQTPCPVPGSRLAGTLWRLPMPTLRDQLVRVLRDRPPWAHALLTEAPTGDGEGSRRGGGPKAGAPAS